MIKNIALIAILVTSCSAMASGSRVDSTFAQGQYGGDHETVLQWGRTALVDRSPWESQAAGMGHYVATRYANSRGYNQRSAVEIGSSCAEEGAKYKHYTISSQPADGVNMAYRANLYEQTCLSVNI